MESPLKRGDITPPKAELIDPCNQTIANKSPSPPILSPHLLATDSSIDEIKPNPMIEEKVSYTFNSLKIKTLTYFQSSFTFQ